MEEIATGYWIAGEISLHPNSTVPTEVIADFLDNRSEDLSTGDPAGGAWIWITATAQYEIVYAKSD